MRKLALLFGLWVWPLSVVASPIAGGLPDAELRGQATLRYLGFAVYDARLYTKNAEPLDWEQDFGLELTYRRNLTQNDLVEATLREMKRIGQPAQIRAQLEGCYKAVGPGDRYLAVSQGPDTLVFWRNEQRTCTLTHPQMKSRFMRIFLGDNTRSARFTRSLLGQ